MKKKIIFEALNFKAFLKIILVFRNSEIFIVDKNQAVLSKIFYNILKFLKLNIRYFNNFYAGDIKFRGEAITLYSLKLARKVIPKIFNNILCNIDLNKDNKLNKFSKFYLMKLISHDVERVCLNIY